MLSTTVVFVQPQDPASRKRNNPSEPCKPPPMRADKFLHRNLRSADLQLIPKVLSKCANKIFTPLAYSSFFYGKLLQHTIPLLYLLL